MLLAEAGCGKTEEFCSSVVNLIRSGRTAFFMRVEDLADDGVSSSLEQHRSGHHTKRRLWQSHRTTSPERTA